MRARTVVVLTGLPGTGKSTLADLLARDTGSPAFAGDWLLGALAPHGILDGVDRPTLLAAFGAIAQVTPPNRAPVGEAET